LKRIWQFAAVIAVVLFLPSCGLLPEEEELPQAPLLRTFAAESFNEVLVTRSDMALTKTVSLTYLPVKTETIKFKVGGEYIKEVFVSVGDPVKAGDLLIELYLDDIKLRLKNAEEALTYLRLKSSHIEEDRLLALNKRKIETSNLDADAQAKELKKVEETFGALARDNADAIYIQEQRVAELTAERDKRQLRAGIDGTITYVRRVREGDMSVMGDRAVSIADSTISAFRGETDLWPYLNPGDEFAITIKKQDYAAVVADETTLGLPAQVKREGEKTYVYLILSQPDLTLSDGDRGTITVTLDTREDVLTLPSKAVTSASGQKIVYYQDEEGMKNIKAVETGLVANGLTEITSGLVEGEAVILE